MRTFFVLCLVLCTVAISAPMAGQATWTGAETASVLLDAPPGAARPVVLVIELEPTPEPTPEPTAPPPTPDPTPEPLPVTPEPTPEATLDANPEATSEATPEALAEPTPKATPKATPKPTAKPTPKPTSSPAPRREYTRQQVIDGIRAGWGPQQKNKAVRVADCESSLNPYAYNPAGPFYGLFQFRKQTWRDYGGRGDPRDATPKRQAEVAWSLYQQRGWDPWPSCA